MKLFSSTKKPKKIFVLYLTKYIVLLALYMIPMLYASKSQGRILFAVILSICFLTLFHFSYRSYVYCRVYLYEITQEDGIFKLTFKKLFSKEDSGCEIVKITEDKFHAKISESLLSINSIGITVYKIEFYQGNQLVFTQYPVGEWSNSKMKKIKSEFERIEKERLVQ